MAKKPCAIVHAFSKLTPSRIVFLVVSNDSLAFSKALRAVRSLLTSEIREKRRSTFRGGAGSRATLFGSFLIANRRLSSRTYRFDQEMLFSTRCETPLLTFRRKNARNSALRDFATAKTHR